MERITCAAGRSSRRSAGERVNTVFKATMVSILLFLLLPAVIYAEDFTWVNTGGGRCAISNYTGPGGAVVIPQTLGGLTVTSIWTGAFMRCDTITSVTIDSSVTSIGNMVFMDCTNLTSVIIGSSVTSIGTSAFRDCTSLTSVIIGRSVTNIGLFAFDGCTSLTEITVDDDNTAFCSADGVLFNENKTVLILFPLGKAGEYVVPDSVTSIASSTFYNCTSLTAVTIGNSVTSIGDNAFYGCKSLTDITFGSSVISLGTGAFIGCSSLTDIIMGGSIASIGSSAFSGCTSLTSVIMGDSVTSIGSSPFNGCTSLTDITVDPENDVYPSFDGVLFNWGKTLLIIYPAGKAGAYVVPDSVIFIGDKAFSHSFNLTDVTIPDSVIGIGEEVFATCSSLTSVTIPDSVTSIGNFALGRCGSLMDITVGTGNPEYSSFEGVLFDKDKTVLIQYPAGKVGAFAIPDGVCEIGERAFSCCYDLTSISIPDSVTGIGEDAFYYCSNLTSISIPDSVTTMGDRAFYSCGLTKIMIGNGVTSIGDNTFMFCDSLVSITIPDSVTSIERNAFSSCFSLTSITIGHSVTSIGDSAFFCYPTSVYFKGNPPSLGKNVFFFTATPTVYYLPAYAANWPATFGGRPTAVWVISPADLNVDAHVNFLDYAVFADRWLSSYCCPSNAWCMGADFNTSGWVDAIDLATFATYWLDGD